MKKLLYEYWSLFLFFSFWVVYFASFWSNAVYFDLQGNFWAGHVNIWGDWAAHFTMGNAMAARGLFIKSPFLLGANFSYPFIADYISSLFIRLGFSLIPAFIIPSFLFSILLVTALYFFYRTIFQSKNIAIIASFIFLFNGGIGFYYFAQDVLQSPQPLVTFSQPLHEYTRIDEKGIKWISVIDSMIIPQRSFALGFSFAILALTLTYQIFFSTQKIYSGKKESMILLFIGVLLGILPILHTHSFLAVFIFLAFWSITDIAFLTSPHERKKHFIKWLIIALTTAVIALPLIHKYFFSNVSQKFFQWYPGWMASEFKLDWVTFIWRNWGITPLLAVLSIFFLLQKKSKQKTIGLLFLPSFFIFILSNLFLFQPWSWDNTKLLVWFHLGTSGLISFLLFHFYQMKWGEKLFGYAKIIIILLLFFTVTASGIIDAYRIQLIQLHSYIMYNSDEVQLSNWVKHNTEVGSIWLTGHPHNHWLFNLTGRQAVMAYPGWLWTQGYDYLPFQQDVQSIYWGSQDTETLLKKYNVDYVVIGPNEQIELSADKYYFDMQFPIVYEFGQTTIYKVK